MAPGPDRQQSSKTPGSRGRTAARGLLVCVAGLFWVFALVGSEGFLRQKERLEHRDALRTQLSVEQAANDDLRREVEALRHDDFAIEQAIRSELDYQRPGEIVLIVEDDDPLGRPVRVRRAQVVAPAIPKELWDATTKRMAQPAAPVEAPKSAPPPAAPTKTAAQARTSSKQIR